MNALLVLILVLKPVSTGYPQSALTLCIKCEEYFFFARKSSVFIGPKDVEKNYEKTVLKSCEKCIFFC